MNVFYGDVNGVQIQQGNYHSQQVQTVVNEELVDYEAVRNVVVEIKKYQEYFDATYGENAEQVREIVKEVFELAEQKKESGKIK